jgi:hypothetical protein
VFPAHVSDMAVEFHRRFGMHPDSLPDAGNNDHTDSGQCPACITSASIAPSASEYRGEGLIHHHWLACGHRWITAVHLPA